MIIYRYIQPIMQWWSNFLSIQLNIFFFIFDVAVKHLFLRIFLFKSYIPAPYTY